MSLLEKAIRATDTSNEPRPRTSLFMKALAAHAQALAPLLQELREIPSSEIVVEAPLGEIAPPQLENAKGFVDNASDFQVESTGSLARRTGFFERASNFLEKTQEAADLPLLETLEEGPEPIPELMGTIEEIPEFEHPVEIENTETSMDYEVDQAVATRFDTLDFDRLSSLLLALPQNSDSILEAWTLLSEALGLAALALFLPQGDFLVLSAQNGFPVGLDEALPLSLVASTRGAGEELQGEDLALLEPILGLDKGLSLRQAPMMSDLRPLGLWVYHDSELERSKAETRANLAVLLSLAFQGLPSWPLAEPQAEPETPILEAARRYASSTIFVFDLPETAAIRAASCKDDNEAHDCGIRPLALGSAFLASCLRILARSGLAILASKHSVVCLLGSSAPADPDLALFQFEKTLRRILPFFARLPFPAGRALSLEPSSGTAREDLRRFISR